MRHSKSIITYTQGPHSQTMINVRGFWAGPSSETQGSPWQTIRTLWQPCETFLGPHWSQRDFHPACLPSFLPLSFRWSQTHNEAWQLCQPCLHTFSHGHLILSWHLIVGGPRITQSEKVKQERYRKVIFSCFIFSFLPEISQLIRKKSIFFHLRTLYTASLILSKLTSTFKTNNEAQEDNLLPRNTT